MEKYMHRKELLILYYIKYYCHIIMWSTNYVHNAPLWNKKAILYRSAAAVAAVAANALAAG